MDWKGKWVLVLVIIAASIGYYSTINGYSVQPLDEQTPSKKTMNITIGYVDDDAVKQIKRLQPTADYIAAKLSDNETSYQGKVVVVKSIEDITELLKEQQVDLYLDSPFATVIAANESGSVPFIKRWKNGVPDYHSVFIVRNNSSINTLDDFKGKTIAFEDKGSTSGYLLPKAHLIQKGFELSESEGEGDIRYIFTGEEENIVLWTIEGRTDIGALSNLDLEILSQSLMDNVRVVDRTVDVPRHVFSHRSMMDPLLVERIEQILVDMDSDPEGAEILYNFQETKKYDAISAEDEIFSNVSVMIDLLN